MSESKSGNGCITVIILVLVALGIFGACSGGTNSSRLNNYKKSDGSIDYKAYEKDVKEGEYLYKLQQELNSRQGK